MTVGSKRFGAYLRAIREARRLTLDDVERLTLHESEPVSRSLLSRLENGKSRISALKLLALSRLYRVRLGVLAERLEIDHETAAIEDEGVDAWPTNKLLRKAAEAGRAGQIHRSLILYEQAEIREMRSQREDGALIRARLGVARSLYAAGKLRLARDVLDELRIDGAAPDDAAWILYLQGTIALELEHDFVARAATSALVDRESSLPEEIRASLPYLSAETLTREGRLDEAFEAWLGAADAARRAAQPAAEGRAFLRLAKVERLRQNPDRALHWIEKAIDHAETHGLAQMRAAALTEQGRVHRDARRFDLARRAWTNARRLARSMALHVELFEVYSEIWRLARSEGDVSEARSSLRTLRHLVRFLDAFPPETDDVRAHLDESQDPSEGTAQQEAR